MNSGQKLEKAAWCCELCEYANSQVQQQILTKNITFSFIIIKSAIKYLSITMGNYTSKDENLEENQSSIPTARIGVAGIVQVPNAMTTDSSNFTGVFDESRFIGAPSGSLATDEGDSKYIKYIRYSLRFIM